MGVAWQVVDHVAIAAGTGRYLVGGGVSLTLSPAGGPYLDLHAVWARPGLFGPVTGPGVGLGATAGYDWRPVPWLTLKGGIGAAFNSANPAGETPRFLAVDLSAGVVF